MESKINTELISSILSIPDNGKWTAEHQDGLSIVHYNNDSYLLYPQLRGIIVDDKVRRVIVPSFGYVPTFTASSLSLTEPITDFTDTDGVTHYFNIKDYKEGRLTFRAGIEGTMVRIFKWNGKVYCSSHRKVDCSRSRWGTKKTFKTMYDELGGPFEDLFDKEKLYSPHCHFFLIVDPSILIATKQRVGNGYLAYLGSFSTWNNSNSPYPHEQVDYELRRPLTVKTVQEAIEKRIPLDSTEENKECNMTMEQITKHLTLGYGDKYSNDMRTGSGEFITVYHRVSNDRPYLIYRIVSPSYLFRSKMRGEDSNVKHRMYSLITDSYLPNREYDSIYPWLMYDNELESKCKEGILYWNVTKPPNTNFRTWDDKFKNLWKCYLLSTPVHRQTEVLTYYDSIIMDRKKVIDWLTEIGMRWLSKVHDERDETLLCDRAKKLIHLAIQYELKRNPTARINKFILEKNIRYLMSNERGDRIYMLIRNHKDYFRTELDNQL